jgi:hypothetical protein
MWHEWGRGGMKAKGKGLQEDVDVGVKIILNLVLEK